MIRSLIPMGMQTPPAVQAASNPGLMEMAAAGTAVSLASNEFIRGVVETPTAFQRGLTAYQLPIQQLTENPGILFNGSTAMSLGIAIFACAYHNVVFQMQYERKIEGRSFRGALWTAITRPRFHLFDWLK